MKTEVRRQKSAVYAKLRRAKEDRGQKYHLLELRGPDSGIYASLRQAGQGFRELDKEVSLFYLASASC